MRTRNRRDCLKCTKMKSYRLKEKIGVLKNGNYVWFYKDERIEGNLLENGNDVVVCHNDSDEKNLALIPVEELDELPPLAYYDPIEKDSVYFADSSTALMALDAISKTLKEWKPKNVSDYNCHFFNIDMDKEFREIFDSINALKNDNIELRKRLAGINDVAKKALKLLASI